MKKNSFVEGTLIASLSLLLIKFLGAVYVIPFYGIVGELGGALYSYAYSVYSLVINICTAGIPLAISKIVSEYNTLEMYDAKERAYKLGKILLSAAGIICFLILFIFAEKIGYLIEKHDEPIYEWGYVTGTRRVVIEDFDKPAYYDSNDFREEHAKAFEGKLYKGETAYYEIVSYQKNGVPIMASCDNKKTKDKDFIKQYGPVTEFSYGCEVGQSDMYVYRMTLSTEDGDVVEYTPDFMRYRCEQMGIKTVPVLWSGIIPDFYQLPDNVGSLQEINAGEFIKNIAEQYYDGADPIGKTHIREGIVARIVNRPGFKAYKYKNFYFKVLENIIKELAEAPDMEEAQEELAGEM